MNSYFNTDFNTGIDWNTVGDYSGAFDNMNSGAFGTPSSASSSSSGQDKWKYALSKGMNWLANDRQNKYRNFAERPSRNSRQNGGYGGGDGFQIAPDIFVSMPRPQQQPQVAYSGGSSGGNIGSTIGGVVGTVGGALLGGPVGAGIGGSALSALGGLFG